MRVLRSLLELPWPIVAGWLLFLALSGLQFLWYRRARVAAIVVQPSAPPRTARRRPVRQLQAATAAADVLPAINLDSIGDTDLSARSQTVLGL